MQSHIFESTQDISKISNLEQIILKKEKIIRDKQSYIEELEKNWKPKDPVVLNKLQLQNLTYDELFLEYEAFKKSVIELLSEKEECIIIGNKNLIELEEKFYRIADILEKTEIEKELREKNVYTTIKMELELELNEKESKNREIEANLIEMLNKSDEKNALLNLKMEQLKKDVKNNEEKYEAQIGNYINEIDKLENAKSHMIRLEEMEKISRKHQKEYDNMKKEIEEASFKRDIEISRLDSEKKEILSSAQKKDQEKEIKISEMHDNLKKQLSMKEIEIQEMRREYEEKMNEIKNGWQTLRLCRKLEIQTNVQAVNKKGSTSFNGMQSAVTKLLGNKKLFDHIESLNIKIEELEGNLSNKDFVIEVIRKENQDAIEEIKEKWEHDKNTLESTKNILVSAEKDLKEKEKEIQKMQRENEERMKEMIIEWKNKQLELIEGLKRNETLTNEKIIKHESTKIELANLKMELKKTLQKIEKKIMLFLRDLHELIYVEKADAILIPMHLTQGDLTVSLLQKQKTKSKCCCNFI